MQRILIVDQDFAERKLINRLFHQKALIDHAADTREALFAFKLSKTYADGYDLIFIDIGEDQEQVGMDILKAIRTMEANDNLVSSDLVPIIMIGGSKDGMMKAFKEGCNDFVLKPFKPKELVTKARELVPA